MAPKAKFTVQWASFIFTVIVALIGIVSAFSVQGEKVKTLEQRQQEIVNHAQVLNERNYEEHKKIIECLAEIKGILKEKNRRTRR